MRASNIKYRYRVNEVDEVVWVDPFWIAFAEENGAAELTSNFVLGRCLWDFLADDETRKLYRNLHERIRTSGEPVVIPFRCDSPSLRRYMRMTIRPEGKRELVYESQLLRAEPQSNLTALDRAALRSDARLTVCSCCKRVLLETVGWLEMEEISVRLKLGESQKVPALRYTTCPDCAHSVANCEDFA